MLKESSEKLLKLNAASHNNASWYTDTDGFIEHSRNGESLYYKGPAFQTIILVWGRPPSYTDSPGLPACQIQGLDYLSHPNCVN